MGLTSLVFIGIAFAILFMLLLIFKADKKDVQKKPHLLSLLALGLIILNWVLCLTGFYAILPQEVSEVVFLPIWFIVCIIGIIAAFRECSNNLVFAVLNAGLSVISFIIGILLLLIGSM